jgi:hypothetical protein
LLHLVELLDHDLRPVGGHALDPFRTGRGKGGVDLDRPGDAVEKPSESSAKLMLPSDASQPKRTSIVKGWPLDDAREDGDLDEAELGAGQRPARP